jgi:tRNA-dihydrouridine synthase B
MHIGPHRLSGRLILAPMAGISDRPFRDLCRQQGAALAVSEMVTADTALWATKKSAHRLNHEGEIGPIVAQIVGADPKRLANAARLNADLGANIIDINMGCPAKKVCNQASGSALLRDPSLVAVILEAVVAASPVPVTLKIRTGWDRQQKNTLQIARIAEATGVQALTIHGRTRADKFSGTAEYDSIRTVKQAVAIPIIANGDIDSPAKAAEVLTYTGADAVMIGRAARGRPWLFRQCQARLEGDPQQPRPSAADFSGLILDHIRAMHDYYGPVQGVKFARKHIAWYLAGHAQSRRLRTWCLATDQAAKQLERVRDSLDELSNHYLEELAA